LSKNEINRTVDDFFDNEYLQYAKYVVENRAIPSVIDGFKPTQRKIAHAANRHWKTGNEKSLKVFQLAGNVAATTFYHHGGASLESAIIGMTQDFKNSMPVFEGIGQFGSLRSPESGAARYVGVKFNDRFKLLYKDFDLLTSQYEEGEEIEPIWFLPIIPTVLLNGGSGIAVGFASNILNRHPKDLIDACLDALSEKKIRQVRPWIKDFQGTFEKDKDNNRAWIIKGVYEVKNTTTVAITEIPPSFTYEKYEQLLDNLEEKGIITGYDDMSTGTINYVVKFNRQKLQELQEKGKLEDVLKLTERDTENLTTLDEFRKVNVFNSAEDIVKYFVDFRIKHYDRRKAKIIENLTREIKVIENRSKFVKMITDNQLKVSGITKTAIETKLFELKFDKESDSFDYLLNMPIHILTREKYDDLIGKLAKKNEELKIINSKTAKDLYVSDLQELRSRLK